MSNPHSTTVVGYCLVTNTVLTDKPQYMVNYRVKKSKVQYVELTEQKHLARSYDSEFFADHVRYILNINTPYTFVVKEIICI